MMFVIGIVAFALAILVSVALHECGHMWVARATGMKVRRYFVGFGPTLWSIRRPHRLGSTEYGIKAVPLGGFCDIAGMTSVEPLDPDEQPYAMYRQKTWKRVAVLFAGPAMNFIIGLVLIYGIALVWGLPSLAAPPAVIGQTACVQSEISPGQQGGCLGSPAVQAGLSAGDTVTAVGDTTVANWEDMVAAVRQLTGPTPFTVERAGQQLSIMVDVIRTQRYLGADNSTSSTVGVIGVAPAAPPAPAQYGPLTAVPATVVFTGELGIELGKALVAIPTKVGALVDAIGGGQRDPQTPISVVGASIIGGDTVDAGLWVVFWFFLAQLNFVLGVINLIPLLPFDGGHIAIAVFEKIRNLIRSARGAVPAAPVDYLKLMPATYMVLAVVMGYMLLTVTADLVNPIRLFQ